MNVYDLLNIKKIDIQDAIEDSIAEIREEFSSLSPLRMCKVYNSYLIESLRKKHVLHRLVDTSDLGCSYSHQFVLVPIDEEKSYLIDLTFSQFQDDSFPQLIENGYMDVDDDLFQKYIQITGKSSINSHLNDVFLPRKQK